MMAGVSKQVLVASLNPLRRILISDHADYNSIIKKLGSPSSFLGYKRLKLKLRVLLAGHIVATVTYCATKLTATCSPMIGQLIDTMIVALTDKEWL